MSHSRVYFNSHLQLFCQNNLIYWAPPYYLQYPRNHLKPIHFITPKGQVWRRVVHLGYCEAENSLLFLEKRFHHSWNNWKKRLRDLVLPLSSCKSSTALIWSRRARKEKGVVNYFSPSLLFTRTFTKGEPWPIAEKVHNIEMISDKTSSEPKSRAVYVQKVGSFSKH